MTDDELENGPTEACGHCGEEIASEAEACPACGELRSAQMCTLHPDRAATGQCVVCGTTVCETCNRGDRHYLCEQHKDVLVVQGWAEVYTTADDLEAHL